MAVREIRTYPDPVLRQVCSAVEVFDAEFEALVTDLSDTLDAMPGCVGIAAPQIGVPRRVVIVDATRHRKPVPNHGRLVLVNPVIQERSGDAVGREGCLSLPDFTANIRRATGIDLVHMTRDGNVTLRCEGFEAVIAQHEMDHLEGILFIDRVECVKTDIFRRKKYL